MHARLVLHNAVHALAIDGEDNFFVTAHRTFGHRDDLDFPSLAVAEVLVHTEQVAGEDAGLVAARAGANLHLGVLAVLGVLRQQQQANLLFQLLFFLGKRIQFHLGHIAELLVLLVGEDILGIGDVADDILIVLVGIHYGLQVFVVLAHLDELLHIVHRVGLGDILANLQPALVYNLQFFK